MGFFYYKKMYGFFARPKKSGHNNKVTVLPRWPQGGLHNVTPEIAIFFSFSLTAKISFLLKS